MRNYFVNFKMNSWESLPFVFEPKEGCPRPCFLRKVDQAERTGWEESLTQVKSALHLIYLTKLVPKV